jgi:hypothetical protein
VPRERPYETLHDVASNGRIDLGQQRTVRIDGLKPAQAVREVARLEGLPPERVEVSVSAFNSQFVIVYGIERQGRPTVLPFRGREPIAEFLSRAGCPDCLKGYRVRIVRPATEVGRTPSVIAVKLDRQFRPEPGSKPVFVESQDFIHLEKDQGRGSVFNRLASRLLPVASGDEGHETTRLFPWFAEPR